MAPAAATQANSLRAFFGRGGRLQQAHPGYEFRPGQLEMARAVAEALESRRHLLIEAGTGTGKTLAYLLPCIASGRRVVISTGTKNLQEQLIFKDVPLLEAALGRDLRVACVKGRNNYACRRRIAELESQPALLTLPELETYGRIRQWAGESELGDRAELAFLPENSPLWERLNARKEICLGQKCPDFAECFLTRLRQQAQEADLIVVNHHLFFADLTLKQRDLPGVLPPYEAVVFDEAHELEEVAGQYFGASISSYQLQELDRDAAAWARLQLVADGPWLGRLQHGVESGLALLLELGETPGRHPFLDRARFIAQNQGAYRRLLDNLRAANGELMAQRGGGPEAESLARRLGDLAEKSAYLFEEDARGVVFWHERRGRGVVVGATPIEVAELLEEHLFVPCDTVILTSATLAVAGSFDYVRGRIGLRHGAECSLPSAFDFERQALLYIPEDLPDPRAEEFTPQAAETIAALLECSGGRAFVLFTSYEQMRDTFARLEARLPFPLLLQGEAPRHLLLERFRATPQAVLFATGSFWQGVDVQGEQLSCVIVHKLPFASPADPVTAARIRAVAEAGGNAFVEFQVPHAVLALKQGFGRLIRSSRDRGVLALLDSRILRQRYGRIFLDSLPPYRRAASIAEVRAFFAGVHKTGGPTATLE